MKLQKYLNTVGIKFKRKAELDQTLHEEFNVIVWQAKKTEKNRGTQRKTEGHIPCFLMNFSKHFNFFT